MCEGNIKPIDLAKCPILLGWIISSKEISKQIFSSEMVTIPWMMLPSTENIFDTDQNKPTVELLSCYSVMSCSCSESGEERLNFAGILPYLIRDDRVKNYTRVETRSNSQKVIDVMEKSSTLPFAVDGNRSPVFRSASSEHLSVAIQFNDLEKKFIEWDDEKKELLSKYQINAFFSPEGDFYIIDQVVYTDGMTVTVVTQEDKKTVEEHIEGKIPVAFSYTKIPFEAGFKVNSEIGLSYPCMPTKKL